MSPRCAGPRAPAPARPGAARDRAGESCSYSQDRRAGGRADCSPGTPALSSRAPRGRPGGRGAGELAAGPPGTPSPVGPSPRPSGAGGEASACTPLLRAQLAGGSRALPGRGADRRLPGFAAPSAGVRLLRRSHLGTGRRGRGAECAGLCVSEYECRLFFPVRPAASAKNPSWLSSGLARACSWREFSAETCAFRCSGFYSKLSARAERPSAARPRWACARASPAPLPGLCWCRRRGD